jgi:hypothetical protein
MAKQTAVEWLLDELKKYADPLARGRDYFFISIPKSDMVSIMEQARHMEDNRIEELKYRISELESMLLERGEQQ